jgi:hypothetical protein
MDARCCDVFEIDDGMIERFDCSLWGDLQRYGWQRRVEIETCLDMLQRRSERRDELIR